MTRWRTAADITPGVAAWQKCRRMRAQRHAAAATLQKPPNRGCKRFPPSSRLKFYAGIGHGTATSPIRPLGLWDGGTCSQRRKRYASVPSGSEPAEVYQALRSISGLRRAGGAAGCDAVECNAEESMCRS